MVFYNMAYKTLGISNFGALRCKIMHQTLEMKVASLSAVINECFINYTPHLKEVQNQSSRPQWDLVYFM
jgi:hypothetical protein